VIVALVAVRLVNTAERAESNVENQPVDEVLLVREALLAKRLDEVLLVVEAFIAERLVVEAFVDELFVLYIDTAVIPPVEDALASVV
jgi:hypothetical protein